MNLTLIRKARIPHRKYWIRANVVIDPQTGKIAKIYKTDKSNKYILTKVDTIIDAKEKLLLPAPRDTNNDLCLTKNINLVKETIQKALKGGVTTTVGIIENNFTEELKKEIKNSIINIYIYLKIKDINISRDMMTDTDLKVIAICIDPNEVALPEKLEADLLLAIDLTEVDPSTEYEKVRKFVNLHNKIHFIGVKNPATIGFLNKLISGGEKKTYDVPLYELLYLESEDFLGILREDKTRKLLLAKLLRKGQIYSVSSGHRCGDKVSGTILEYYLSLYYTLAKKLNMSKPLEIVKPIAMNPAKTLESKFATVKTGADANLVLFNHRSKWRITDGPLENLAIRGRIEATLLNGKLLINNN